MEVSQSFLEKSHSKPKQSKINGDTQVKIASFLGVKLKAYYIQELNVKMTNIAQGTYTSIGNLL